MIARRFRVLCARAAALGVLMTLALFAPLPRQAWGQSALNLVYVESNIGSVPGMNSVFAFSNDGNGNLTALPGSPYLTHGTGLYNPGGATTAFDADGQVIIRPDGNLLLAVNSHTNTIAVFTINSDGSLTAVQGSPFASGGQQPVSLSLAYQVVNADTDILTVVNKAQDPNQTGGIPNFSTFFFSSTGTITSTGQSVQLRAGSSPSQVLFNPVSKILIADDFKGAELISYRLNKTTGALTQLSSVSGAAGAPFLGMVLHPTKSYVYAAQPSADILYAYSDAGFTGVLTQTSAFPDPGMTPCWLAMNSSGTRMYVSETASNTISVFQTGQSPNAPVLLQTLALSGAAGNPINIALDPTGRFLYVVHNKDVIQASEGTGPVMDNGTDLHVLNVATNGLLTETKPPTIFNVSSGETPVGIAVLMK
jgi:6-phosphogluconolactonase (cycloisomerase 2 family)